MTEVSKKVPLTLKKVPKASKKETGAPIKPCLKFKLSVSLNEDCISQKLQVKDILKGPLFDPDDMNESDPEAMKISSYCKTLQKFLSSDTELSDKEKEGDEDNEDEDEDEDKQEPDDACLLHKVGDMVYILNNREVVMEEFTHFTQGLLSKHMIEKALK